MAAATASTMQTDASYATRPPTRATPRSPRPPLGNVRSIEPPASPKQIRRRRFTWAALKVLGLILGGCTVKFFFPRTLTEPKTTFTIGRVEDYPFGVYDGLQDSHRIWVCCDTVKLYVIRAICTHLGCTPNWLPSEHKFKCPCHGSGYDSGGVNLEGPAPRPMDRCHVELDSESKIVVDVLRLYGEPRWNEPGVFIPLTA